MNDFKKEEMVKLCQSGNIPIICDLIKKGYLDNLNEEIKFIFLEVNPKLKHHLENSIKKKEKKKINESVYILLKLMEWGDQIARKVFKEEIVKLCQSGYIPMIWYLFKEGYLDNLNEEIKLIFLEVNPKLKHHLENTRKKKMINKSIYILLKLMERGDQIAKEVIIKKKKLKEINLSNSNLTELPAWLSQLTSLQTLDLGGNQLTELPTTFGQLTALQTLKLEENQLAKLPSTFGQLTVLQFLDLGKNQLAELPESLGQFKALQTLYLDDNQLTELPASLEKLTALKILTLVDNHLAELLDSRTRNIIEKLEKNGVIIIIYG